MPSAPIVGVAAAELGSEGRRERFGDGDAAGDHAFDLEVVKVLAFAEAIKHRGTVLNRLEGSKECRVNDDCFVGSGNIFFEKKRPCCTYKQIKDLKKEQSIALDDIIFQVCLILRSCARCKVSSRD